MSQNSTNHIKFGSSSRNSISVNGFSVGVSGGDDYGPTSDTGFYNGIVPPAGGYTIYVDKASNGPSIHVPRTDEECLLYLNKYGANAGNISDALTWASTQSNLFVRSSEYTLGDLPGASPYTFTITSSDINNGFAHYNSQNGHNYPSDVLGTNGNEGYTLTYYGGEQSWLFVAGNVPYLFNVNNQSIVDVFDNLVSLGELNNNYETALWDVSWAAGSTYTSGVVSLRGISAVNDQIYLSMLDTTDPNYDQTGNNSAALAGTYLFPATFTLRRPVVNKGGWC